MRLPESVEKVPSEKKYRERHPINTLIFLIIPSSKTELWLAVVQEPSNRESPNFQLKVRWVHSVD